MTTTFTITKAEATKVLTALIASLGPSKAAVKKSYGSLPTLVKDWEWGWTTINTYAWAILWEEGPYEWTYRFPGGGFDEEMYSMALEFGEENARRLATKPGVDLPDSVWTEPVTSWAIAIYPKDSA